MNLKLLIAIILTFLPITELRAGLPLAISYAVENNVSIPFIFFIIIFFNILVTFFAFYFLDHLHKYLERFEFYREKFNKKLKKSRKKVENVQKNYNSLGFLALVIFVAIPIPGTGAWTGSFIAWLLNFDRKKSILSISAGVIIAGLLVLFGTLGALKLFF